ncbi:MAG: sugar transferase [Thermoguttaceae bacterium]|jgi:lipopolysaccharide/colanic/teichoic acid biosynthesis glycosyltransferase
MFKRAFDFIAAAIGLVLISPVLVVVAALIKCETAGPVIFRQERVGKRFRHFFVYKFRTMKQDAPRLGGQITFGDDPRITRVGRFLRKTKIDELPQLFNVLKGDMSLVGPRPEVPRYVDMFREDYAVILQVRPGITDLASIKYRDEAEILGRAENPEEEYVKRVLPEKIRYAKQYVDKASLLLDFRIILQTIARLFVDKVHSPY